MWSLDAFLLSALCVVHCRGMVPHALHKGAALQHAGGNRSAQFLRGRRDVESYYSALESSFSLGHNLGYFDDDLHPHNELSKEDAEKLSFFWTIALSSYFLSGLFAFLVWTWFGRSGSSQQGEDGGAIVPKPRTSMSDLNDTSDEDDEVQSAPSRASMVAGSTRPKSTPSVQSLVAEERDEWKKDTRQERLQIAALTLLLIGCLMVVYDVMRFIDRPHCAPFLPKVHGPEMLWLGCLMALAVLCANQPSPALYWPTLVLFLLYIPASQLPPFNLSCDLLQACRHSQHWRVVQAVRHADCSLQGQTAQQIFLTVFLLLPWLLPDKRLMDLMWVWIAAVYVIWSIAYIRYSPDGNIAFGNGDVMIRSVLLSCTLVIAYLKKKQMQKSQRNKWASDRANRDASMRLYNILAYMLPEHVILPMLLKPGEGYSEAIDEVTILFIVIDDFESIVQSKTPDRLLKFLNDNFTQMDQICKANNVTKIETVGEEYVVAVGVMPDDKDESETYGHSVVLGRLFQAASDIMALQTGNVKFKMGMHTGPVVAGVIGNKLPRFRLFGDTINTSARMMQKGVVGQVQFGEATHKHLPEDVEEVIVPRGKVEMKGKGQVETFLFSGGQLQSGAVAGTSSRVLGESSRSIVGLRGAESSSELAPRKAEKKVTIATEPLMIDIPSDRISKSFKSSQADDSAPPTPQTGDSTASGLLKLLTSSRRYFTSAYDDDDDDVSSPMIEKRRAFSNVDFKGVCEKIEEANRVIDQGRRWDVPIVSEKRGFTPEMEERFKEEFHAEALCKKLLPTIDKFVVLVFIASVVEALWNTEDPHNPHLSNWNTAHGWFGSWARLPIFLACRASIIAIIISFRFAATRTQWVWDKTDLFQIAWVVITWATVLLLYLSYHVMIAGSAVEFDGHLEAPPDQIFSLFFVLIFFLVIRFSRLQFYYSLAYILLAMVIVCLTRIRSKSGVYFPNMGQVLILTIAVSNSVLSHAEEQSVRARFKARHALAMTKDRVRTILNTMMPPAVLAEVRRSADGALPSHQYELATIAQSDLCGFTALASTRTPREVVKFMSDLFGLFDDLCTTYGIYKVETVGDAYIAGQAEYPLTAENSPTSVIRFGIAMVIEVINWAKRMGVDVRCRVGVHHGHCLGGIVGTDMQRYHLFGSLMQGLEVLESTAPEGGVQVSLNCRDAVVRELQENESSANQFEFKEREGKHLVTSKGEVHQFDEVGGRTFVVQGPAFLRG